MDKTQIHPKDADLILCHAQMMNKTSLSNPISLIYAFSFSLCEFVINRPVFHRYLLMSIQINRFTDKCYFYSEKEHVLVNSLF
jgi:hypothetical protein